MKRKTLVTATIGALLFSGGALANDFLNDPVKYVGLYNAKYTIQVNDRPGWTYDNSDLIDLPGRIDYPNGGMPPAPPHVAGRNDLHSAIVPNHPPYVTIGGVMYVPLRRLANDLGLQIEFTTVANIWGDMEPTVKITGTPKSAPASGLGPGSGSGSGSGAGSSGSGSDSSASAPPSPSTEPAEAPLVAIAAPEGPTEFKGAQRFRTNGYSRMILHKSVSNTLLGFTIKYNDTQSYVGFRELPFTVDVGEMEQITVEPVATSVESGRTAKYTVEFLR